MPSEPIREEVVSIIQQLREHVDYLQELGVEHTEQTLSRNADTSQLSASNSLVPGAQGRRRSPGLSFGAAATSGSIRSGKNADSSGTADSPFRSFTFHRESFWRKPAQRRRTVTRFGRNL
jgi:hypothetical protein